MSQVLSHSTAFHKSQKTFKISDASMKFQMDDLTLDERTAVETLRARMRNSLQLDMYEDILLFYRFLKARDFDVDEAEVMLQKHIHWRKSFQFDTVMEDFEPKEIFAKYVHPNIIGFDKDGCIVTYSPTGKVEMKEVFKCLKMRDFQKHFAWLGSKLQAITKKQIEIRGGKASQLSVILDLNELTFGNAIYRGSSEFYLFLVNTYQNNFPEYMKSVYVINAPAYYVMVFSLVKAIMSSVMIQKIHVFGYSGWKEKLLEAVDADVLPAFLGGNRTDPDGDPLCRSLVNHGGKIPSVYFLSDKDRYFKDRTGVSHIVVPRMKKEEIFVDVNELGSRIHWEFCTKSNIGFGLFYQASEQEIEEVIPIMRYDTSDGTEEDSYKVRSVGKYILVYDNTYSWIMSKEVEYRVRIIHPEL